MNTEGKVWGRTTTIAGAENFSAHFLEILAGGFSSKHRHRIKENKFFVISGSVQIRTWRKGGTDLTVLGRGESYSVAPGAWHQFEALADSLMIEIYTAKLEHPDIERANVGGLRIPEDQDPRLNFKPKK